MDDDDEFGDLYTDVLLPVSAPPPPLVGRPSAASASASAAPNPHPNPFFDDDNEEERILYGAQPPARPPPSSSHLPQSLASGPGDDDGEDDWLLGRGPTAVEQSENWEDDDDGAAVRPSVAPGPDLPGLGDPRVLEEEEARASEADAVDTAEAEGFLEKDEDPFLVGGGAAPKTEIDDPYEEPVIPGLSTSPGFSVKASDARASGSDYWDSDSEDDLQIVLNESNPGGERNDGLGEDDEEEDGEEDLVIVADVNQPIHHQVMEEQDWGEEAMQPAPDGERKEMSEAGKVNSVIGNATGARIGYSNHGFHQQHHSMYKYVRPGARPVPGGPVVGAIAGSGQIRPPLTLGPTTGRGRGDWRPPGGRGIPNAQKIFNSGYGLPVWANNSSGRAFDSVLDFTLPSHKTSFDIDIESFDEKPWRHPGVDISDFFNFGLDEENWKDYCKQLEQLRLEATMQSKIRVYESGRSDQDYDPDLPPELAAAAGHHDSSDNAHHGKTDNVHSDLNGLERGAGAGAGCMRAPLPIGRAIQVEGGYGERLPSIDTRPPRIRYSDAIIEIVLQGTLDDPTMHSGELEQPLKELQGGDLKGDHDFEDDRDAESESFDRFSHSFDGQRKERVTRKSSLPSEDVILPFPSDSHFQNHPNSKIRSPLNSSGPHGTRHGGRLPPGTSRGRHASASGEYSVDATSDRSAQVSRHDSHQRENPGDSIEANQTSEISPARAVSPARELSLEQRDGEYDDRLALGDSIEVEGDDMASDFRISSETPGDDSLGHSTKKQKLSSRVEQPPNRENGDTDDLRATHSDNSRARSGSSKDYQKRREGGEEVMQDGRSRRTGDLRKRHEEEEHSFRRKDDYGRDGRHETDRNHRVTSKGREGVYHPYSQRNWDSNAVHHVRGRSEGFERQKEMDGRQRREDDINRRVKDDELRRERNEETGSKNRNKAKIGDRNDKDDEIHLKKRMDGDWRDRHREGGPKQRDRDDNLRRRENLDDPPTKRKKDEDNSRREKADKEDILHGHRAREDSSRRKRERVDGPDLRRREDDTRMRDKTEDRNSVKHRDDGWREREDRQRRKQTQGDPLTHREREEGRAATRNGRATEDKSLAGNGKSKDDSKGMGSDKDKDRRRHIEQFKRVDRGGEGNDSQNKGREDVHAREKQSKSEERNSRHERLSSHSDRPSNASEGQQMHREKHKENTRKIKDIEINEQNTQRSGKRKHEELNTHRNDKANLKGTSEQGQINEQPEVPQLPQPSVKLGEEDPASDDENQRGRSKLERWTSQKERDYNITNNIQSLPSSSRIVRVVEDANAELGQADESTKTEGNSTNESEPKDVDAGQIADKIGEDRDGHLDTVAKLKRRSERFKLPMPGEKDASINKMVENEVQLTLNDAAADLEIKPERPARKRRWTGS